MNEKLQEEINKKLYARASSYVPEWTHKEDDIGVALLHIYGMQHANSLARFHQLREKRSRQFFNTLKTVQKTAMPAKGYVTFGLSSEDTKGVVVYRNSDLNTSRQYKNGMPVKAETVDDIFVTSSKLNMIMESQGEYIIKSSENPKTIFSLNLKNENLQKHILILQIENTINIKNMGKITLSLFENFDEKIKKEKLTELLHLITFSYSTQTGYEEFNILDIEDDSIVLEKDNSQEITPFEEDQFSSLKLEVRSAKHFKEFSLRDIRISSQAELIKPDGVNAVGIQYDGKEPFYPFSDKPSVYNEMYLYCDEAFSKLGSKITIDFLMEFEEIFSDNFEEEKRHYKLIMNKKDVLEEPIYNITISDVVFEYFNGYGFANLFTNKKHSDIFSDKNGTHRQRKRIEFICPDDFKPTIVNGIQGYYIRVRIHGMNNAFKLRTKYISPIISDINLSFIYNNAVQPKKISTWNNLENKHFTNDCFKEVYPFYPFVQLEELRHCVYFGFTKPLLFAPIKILFDISYSKVNRKLIWQYYTEKGFVNLDLLDETNHLAHTGLITIKDLPDHTKTTIFGEEAYFLRLVDIEEHTDSIPIVLNGIHINSVVARATKSKLVKEFSANTFQSEYIFNLEEVNIYEAKVLIDETDNLYVESISNESITEKNGKKWVQWFDINEVDSKEKRVYILDKKNGILQFLSNKKLPEVSEEKNIRVEFSIGGGTETNLQAGEITGLALSHSFINKGTNIIPFFGGTDIEDIESAKFRAGSEFRNKMRAVTSRDFETLIMHYNQNIAQVRCFSNINENGEKAISKVTLVVLNTNFSHNSFCFETFKAEILHYLSDKILHGMKNKINIIEPNFIKFNIQVTLKVAEFNHISEVRESVLNMISEFLDPINGNFNKKGFVISEPPKREQIESLLQDIKLIETIKSLVITGSVFNGIENNVYNQDEIFNIPFVLPQNGTHNIIIDLD